MRDLSNERGKVRHIVFCEKQAQFYCVENSKQARHWIAKAKAIREQISETRPWHELQSIYNLRGEV